jgi:hypothetical protein
VLSGNSFPLNTVLTKCAPHNVQGFDALIDRCSELIPILASAMLYLLDGVDPPLLAVWRELGRGCARGEADFAKHCTTIPRLLRPGWVGVSPRRRTCSMLSQKASCRTGTVSGRDGSFHTQRVWYHGVAGKRKQDVGIHQVVEEDHPASRTGTKCGSSKLLLLQGIAVSILPARLHRRVWLRQTHRHPTHRLVTHWHNPRSSDSIPPRPETSDPSGIHSGWCPALTRVPRRNGQRVVR